MCIADRPRARRPEASARLLARAVPEVGRRKWRSCSPTCRRRWKTPSSWPSAAISNCRWAPTTCPISRCPKATRSSTLDRRGSAQHGLERRLAEARAGRPASPRADYDARLASELDVIDTMGFPGYFLIVADFINWAKQNDIPVGPGRGSGAGSLVAWALGITDLDPIRYDLLFERFLNPERVSMPDFDIDFCMDRRDEVIDYVAHKYGRDKVSQIITYGTMAAKAVVRDSGRVLGYPYGFVDSLAKLIPLTLGRDPGRCARRIRAAKQGQQPRIRRTDRALPQRGRRARPARPGAQARGPDPQRRQARRRRGDRADAADQLLAAVRRTRRQGRDGARASSRSSTRTTSRRSAWSSSTSSACAR